MLRLKIFLIISCLGLMGTGGFFLGGNGIVSANFTENPDHYRLSHNGVVNVFNNLIYEGEKEIGTFIYPFQNGHNFWRFSQDEVQPLFKDDSTILGLQTTDVGNSKATDGYKTIAEVKAKNLQQNFYLPYNAVNQHNYQMFFCENGSCSWRQKKNGRILEDENSQLKVGITGDEWGENWNQDGYYRIAIDYEKGKKAKLKITKHESYQISNLAELEVNLEDKIYFFEQDGRSATAEPFNENNESGLFERQKGMTYANFGRQTYQQSDDLLKNFYTQTDDRWRDYRYGSGWQKKIGNWGCAMTGMAMILNYWGYEQTGLNGWQTQINPLWLNNQLIHRKGGYVQEDYVNWVEVTKVVADLHKEAKAAGIDLPKLEYQYAGKEGPLARVVADLEKGQPVLTKINKAQGHWLVAINDHDLQEGEKIRVADPYYDGYRFLEEHQEQGVQVTNAISFNPSYTDLSYWLVFSSNPHLRIQAVEKVKKEVVTFEMSDESVGGKDEMGENAEEGGEGFYHYYVAKPENGEWQIRIKNEGAEKAEFEVALYNQYATLVYDNLENEEELETEQMKGFQIKYDKRTGSSYNASTPIEIIDELAEQNGDAATRIGLREVEEKVNELREKKQMTLMLYYYLQRILAGAKLVRADENTETQKRYVEHLQAVLDYYDVAGNKKPYGMLQHIDEEGLQELRDILVFINP